jgi:cytochrome oxidase assembly protein ShyY1
MAKPTASEVLRLAFSPKWLLRAGVGVLIILGFIFLGRWQWDRSQDVLAREQAALALPIAVDVLNPLGSTISSDTVGRAITAQGTYVGSQQRYVVHRESNGRPGVWVVTPLRLADGSLLAVMRGWLPTVSSPGATTPEGPIALRGTLQADESFYKGAKGTGNTVPAISQDTLKLGPNARWGYVRMTSQQPQTQPAPIPVPVPPAQGSAPFPLQNFFYAIQWWVFALFIVGAYLRWLWLTVKESSDSKPDSAVG